MSIFDKVSRSIGGLNPKNNKSLKAAGMGTGKAKPYKVPPKSDRQTRIDAEIRAARAKRKAK